MYLSLMPMEIHLNTNKCILLYVVGTYKTILLGDYFFFQLVSQIYIWFSNHRNKLAWYNWPLYNADNKCIVVCNEITGKTVLHDNVFVNKSFQLSNKTNVSY